ncbi:MAG: PilZ domain-containing protein [Lacunisphaera sp.]
MVLLFKSILEDEIAPATPDDKRRLPRYPVGDDFIFRTKLTLFQSGGKGKDWSATPVNLSVTGASVQVSLAAVAFQREKCVLKFSHGDYHLELPGTIAHFRCYSQYSLCGIVFNFPDTESQQAYFQLLEPVAIGGSLKAVDVVQDAPGRPKEQYAAGNGSAALTIWRDEPENAIISFDFRMRQYGVSWTQGLAELEVYGLSVDPTAAGEDIVTLTDEQNEEVRWLFCLAVPNLSKAVPLDVRKFLATLVA